MGQSLPVKADFKAPLANQPAVMGDRFEMFPRLQMNHYLSIVYYNDILENCKQNPTPFPVWVFRKFRNAIAEESSYFLNFFTTSTAAEPSTTTSRITHITTNAVETGASVSPV